MLSFGPFRLDLDSERLWKHDVEVQLRRRPFAILRFLVQNPKRLVTYADIVEAVWGKTAISEGLLRNHVHHLRSVLGDGVVETVVGRGYRFMAEIDHVYASEPKLGSSPARDDASTHLVGRESELDALRSALRAACDGRRTTVFVTGEAGVGKTTLVDAFVEQAREHRKLLVGRGACVEQYGSGQAYLPVLEAIGDLCRGPDASRTIDVFAKHASTWLAQMPALVRPERLAEIQRRAKGATPGRWMRELAEALDALSTEAPVLIVFDDLQWTDPSTAEFMAFLASRREPARLLLVGTFRTAEAPRDHAVRKLTGELSAHRQASTIFLGDLPEDAIDAYLSRRFPGHRFPLNLAMTVHELTGGNPLFLTTLIDELVGKKLLLARDGQWELSTSIEDVAARRFDSVRRLIDTRIDRLTHFEQRIVETAAVAGASFTAGVVAYTLDADVDAVDSACESLANERRLLRYIGAEIWPDGTIQPRYAFVHSLFQHAALTRSTSAAVRVTHRKIGERLEAGYAGREEDVATELAVHFDRGQMPARAARHYLTAGDEASRHYGLHEAVAHYQRVHALAERLAEGRERDHLAMRATLGLGWRLLQRDGSSDAALPVAEKARELAERLNDKASLAEALIRLVAICVAHGDLRASYNYARAVAPLREHLTEALRDLAQDFEAFTVLVRGDLEGACRRFAAIGVFPVVEGETPVGAAASRIVAMAFGSYALWLAGKPAQAVSLARRGYDVATALNDPWERAALLSDWATVHAWRREPAKAKELAQRSLELADGAFDLWTRRADLVVRWAEVELGAPLSDERAEELLSKPWECASHGRTLPTVLFATMCARLGRTDRGLEVISEALRWIDESEERWLEAELYRLRGDIVASRNALEAERSFATAIQIAQSQGAVSLELRATLSLHTVLSGAAKTRASDELARLLTLVAEGDGGPDVVEARRVVGNHTRRSSMVREVATGSEAPIVRRARSTR